MLKPLLLAGLAAAAFIPSLASAQESCQQARHDNRVAGTIVGAGLGAILGGAITGHGGGAVAGGVGGAVAGNVIAGSGTRCGENQYGYYDGNGQWVPRTSTAYGYYGPDGQWVANGPNGGYAQGGPDRDQGYGYAPPPPAQGYGQDAAYTGRGHMSIREREDHMDQWIRNSVASGRIDNRSGRHAQRDLSDIRRMEADYRNQNGGHLDDQQRADIDQRLDGLRDTLHMDMNGAPRSY